ncbi:hypothetical protein [Parahaliea mediterranea]|uniref:hypothetical protein n=1 Tax=Parahaliea mediterranea TaxID=651086 RepID=UPI000E2ED7C1|nr:hypothetical protein [Parahaliea mediterranea]
MPLKHVEHGVLGALTLALAPVLQAHPGHDHGHWFSPTVHALTLLAVGLVAALAVRALRKRGARQSQGK